MPRKSGKQSQQGKAFEYACLIAIYDNYKNSQKIVLNKSEAMTTARKDFESVPELRENLESGASAAVRIVQRLEPKLMYPEGDEPLYLSIQKDGTGMDGDVRDVLCIRTKDDWQIGFSCKHNHDAVKHSRLSDVLDFGDKWVGYPCSKEYFDTIKPIFSHLRKLKQLGRERNRPVLWEELSDKEGKVYYPILKAFINELRKLDAKYDDVPERLVKYLIGRNDFYKIIADDKHRITTIEAVNLSGTLNRKAGLHKPVVTIPIAKTPTKFYDIDFAENSRSTIIIGCNNGWEISMRIHNADSKVEPSLKFDVRLVSSPRSIHTEMEPWD